MLRNRTVTQDKSNTSVKDDNNKAEESNVSAGPATKKGFCAKVTDVGKVVLLIIFIPPFLNYASLQREGALLVPEGAQSVDIGLGQKVHLLCKGQGEPVVLLDAPTGMSSESWFYIQEEVSQKTRVCTYDRVGLGFSKRALQNQTTGTEKVWGVSTTGRMVDDLHRLVKAAEMATPLVLVGSELGALNARFYSHIHDTEVSDLVLIDPIPEGIFQEGQWQKYWYSQLVPYLQMMQLAAATGLTRIFIILGWIHPAINGEMVSEDVIQRQSETYWEMLVKELLYRVWPHGGGDKDPENDSVLEFSRKRGKFESVPVEIITHTELKYLMSNPSHQSSAVDEHFFLNESASQVREISVYKPLASRSSVSMVTGDHFDSRFPAHLNQIVAEHQKRFQEQFYPSAKRIHIRGADRRAIYEDHSLISRHLQEIVEQRQLKQQSQ